MKYSDKKKNGKIKREGGKKEHKMQTENYTTLESISGFHRFPAMIYVDTKPCLKTDAMCVRKIEFQVFQVERVVCVGLDFSCSS